MVDIDVPVTKIESPSSLSGSLSGTPYLTINKNAADDIDSSSAFEGPEKLLEVWFSRSAQSLPPSAKANGLKAVSAKTWKGMLDLVNCQVLSTIESEHVDAYLLSESSMFVFPHKLVLKTCGTTTLLNGLPRMLEIAAEEAGFPRKDGPSARAANPYRVFYSRKNFLYPEKQYGPHTSWETEVGCLDKEFRDGSAYTIGKMNGEHWYLYITAPSSELTPPRTPEYEKQSPVAGSAASAAALSRMQNLNIDAASDETLEILMTDLDEGNAKQFYHEYGVRLLQRDNARTTHETKLQVMDRLSAVPEGTTMTNGQPDAHGSADSDSSFDVFDNSAPAETTHGAAAIDVADDGGAFSEGHILGRAVAAKCGLNSIYPSSDYPDAKVDSFLFSPCGFSANGVIPNPEDNGTTHYFTVHVTPEPICSYASFETNVPAKQTGRETADIVAQVVDIFKPGRFSVTLFEAKGDEEGSPKMKKAHKMDTIPGYRRVDRVLHDLEGYELVFRHFERHGFRGGLPRIGEPRK